MSGSRLPRATQAHSQLRPMAGEGWPVRASPDLMLVSVEVISSHMRAPSAPVCRLCASSGSHEDMEPHHIRCTCRDQLHAKAVK